MVATKILDKEITSYLKHLSDHQKEVVLSVVKTFAGEEESVWDDEEFVAEIDLRTAELENGKVKGIKWEEIKKNVRNAYQKKLAEANAIHH